MTGHQPAEFRLREAHHRIANDLTVIATMVRLQASALPEDRPLSRAQASGLLKDAAGRVEAVARLHRALCEDLNGHTASEFLGGVCADAAKFAGAPAWNVTCNVELKQDLPHEQLRALGLLLHEFVLNALKHAHPTGVAGIMDIWVREEEGALAVDIRDDGVGLPEGFDSETADGFGFRMIRELAKQLDAQITFRSSPLGLSCRVRGRAPLRPKLRMSAVAD